jgi:hypothetical protein
LHLFFEEFCSITQNAVWKQQRNGKSKIKKKELNKFWLSRSIKKKKGRGMNGAYVLCNAWPGRQMVLELYTCTAAVRICVIFAAEQRGQQWWDPEISSSTVTPYTSQIARHLAP